MILRFLYLEYGNHIKQFVIGSFKLNNLFLESPCVHRSIPCKLLASCILIELL